jgi:hypothetical protein
MKFCALLSALALSAVSANPVTAANVAIQDPLEAVSALEKRALPTGFRNCHVGSTKLATVTTFNYSPTKPGWFDTITIDPKVEGTIHTSFEATYIYAKVQFGFKTIGGMVYSDFLPTPKVCLFYIFWCWTVTSNPGPIPAPPSNAKAIKFRPADMLANQPAYVKNTFDTKTALSMTVVLYNEKDGKEIDCVTNDNIFA